VRRKTKQNGKNRRGLFNIKISFAEYRQILMSFFGAAIKITNNYFDWVRNMHSIFRRDGMEHTQHATRRRYATNQPIIICSAK